jgi:hypothetical protein
VQPVEAAGYAHAGLIGMGHRRFDERAADGRNRLFQACGRYGYGAMDGTRRYGNAGQFVEHPGGALIRKQLVLGHVHRERRYAGSVLYRCLNVFGKGVVVHAPAGTGSANDAVFGGFSTDLQLDDLAPLRKHLGGNLCTAASAVARAR